MEEPVESRELHAFNDNNNTFNRFPICTTITQCANREKIDALNYTGKKEKDQPNTKILSLSFTIGLSACQFLHRHVSDWILITRHAVL